MTHGMSDHVPLQQVTQKDRRGLHKLSRCKKIGWQCVWQSIGETPHPMSAVMSKWTVLEVPTLGADVKLNSALKP